jgi:hypothetical protein
MSSFFFFYVGPRTEASWQLYARVQLQLEYRQLLLSLSAFNGLCPSRKRRHNTPGNNTTSGVMYQNKKHHTDCRI